MRNGRPELIGRLLVCALLVSTVPLSVGEEPIKTDSKQVAGEKTGTGSQAESKVDTNQSTETEAPESPLSFDVSYALYSDYVFRGINLSEYAGEGREKPNHQVTAAMNVDLAGLLNHKGASYGTLSFGTFLEWFGAQHEINSNGGQQNLQEVDYTVSWSYDIDAIATTATLGYVFYTYPNAKPINSQEWNVKLEHNDAWMWRWLFPNNEDGVLNPYFLFAQDTKFAPRGIWLETGISHDFGVIENVTVTPSLTLGIDHRYLDPILATGRSGSTRLAYLQYGLNMGYNLSEAMGWSDKYGEVVLSAFMYFSDALGTAEDNDTIQDQFFGGTSIAWSF